jgi:hypothetical protein
MCIILIPRVLAAIGRMRPIDPWTSSKISSAKTALLKCKGAKVDGHNYYKNNKQSTS